MFSFKSMVRSVVYKKKFGGFVAISIGRVVVPSSKIAINLPRTYEKLHNKGEPYRFSGWRDLRYRQTNKQTEILLLYYKDKFILYNTSTNLHTFQFTYPSKSTLFFVINKICIISRKIKSIFLFALGFVLKKPFYHARA